MFKMENPKFYSEFLKHIGASKYLVTDKMIMASVHNSGTTKEEWETVSPELIPKVIDGVVITIMQGLTNKQEEVKNEQS